ncbi:phosphatase PAP2 family protein [Noviherbaspirillum sp. L7-7A]|uniref:phosphatase PAP2 family protein n=1 Tax=Noviherbaspirillum sp. L7-7A TaxID=2850560 RepID=UPI001C2C80FC|nr:phosphatase PAP2 family protein [Noviherbaspirillum sp. L7-7A]MBV0881819.1 phosphatase PAP2 family protein [Noviherbaspirillum sp. L7-7A]
MSQRRFLACLALLLCFAVVLVYIGRYTELDLMLADHYYDAAAAAFPGRDDWFFEFVMHHMAKALMVAVGMVSPLALLADRLLGYTLLSNETRRAMWLVALSSVAIPVAITITKYLSIHHCPWNLTRYGGFAPYLRVFDALPAGVSAGRCFPAGHASSALWLASVCAFWLPARPLRALGVFLLGLLPGLALGWVQQMRGAHFLTHTLWSLWIAALVILLLTRLILPAPDPSAGSDAGQTCGLPVHEPSAIPVDGALEEPVDRHA